jgi:hypothetical protein
VLAQRIAHRGATECTAAEGEHRRVWSGPPGLEQFQRDSLLGRPECRLAVLGEDPLDRLAQLLLDHLVDVDRAGAQDLRGAASGGRLSRPHEADHRDDPAAPGGCRRRAGRHAVYWGAHPMRSR